MNNLNNRSYFFDKGIRFECQQCGVCCTGSPGTIYVDKSEVSSIAKFLKIPVTDFKKNIYTLSKTVIVSGNIRMEGVSFMKTGVEFTLCAPANAVPIHSGLPICVLRKIGKVFPRSAGGLDKDVFIQRKKYLKLSRPHFRRL